MCSNIRRSYECKNCGGVDKAIEEHIVKREDLCLICFTLKENGKDYIIPKKENSSPYGHLHFRPHGLRRENTKRKKRDRVK